MLQVLLSRRPYVIVHYDCNENYCEWKSKREHVQLTYRLRNDHLLRFCDVFDDLYRALTERLFWYNRCE